jgi:hypothetical protein
VDTRTFITRLVEALAWPTVVLLLAFTLRRHITRLLSLVSKLRAGPVEAEFAREVQELRQEVGVEAAATRPGPLTDQQLQLFQLARVSPRAAIIEAWQLVDFAARDLINKRGLTIAAKVQESPLALGRLLAQHSLLEPVDIDLFNQLRRLRNEAIHARNFDPSEEAALNYIDLSLRLYGSILSRSLMLGDG